MATPYFRLRPMAPFRVVLIGLFNRRKVETHLESQIKGGRSSSVIYLGLKSSKQINDTLEHLAGDDLLKQFADEPRTPFPRGQHCGSLGRR